MTDYINEYCMHTATCGELRMEDVDREVVLTGWVWHNRDHGGLIFIDLRDRAGYTQVVVDPDCVSADEFSVAEHLGREYVIKVAGRVRARMADAVNPNMATGEIELLAKVTPRVVPGTVCISQGAWHNADMNGDRVDKGGCINTLTTHRPSPLAKGNPQHSNICEVVRA